MQQNNTRLLIGAVLALSLVRTATAGVEIADARARVSPDDPQRVEVYFELRNDTAHELELLKAVSPLAQSVELKQRSVGADGIARIWPVAKLELPPRARLRLHADARFFLLSGFDAAPRAGQPLSLTLTFEDEPSVTLQLVLAAAPTSRN